MSVPPMENTDEFQEWKSKLDTLPCVTSAAGKQVLFCKQGCSFQKFIEIICWHSQMPQILGLQGGAGDQLKERVIAYQFYI